MVIINSPSTEIWNVRVEMESLKLNKGVKSQVTKLEINSETYTVYFTIIPVGILTPVLSIAVLFNQDSFLK